MCLVAYRALDNSIDFRPVAIENVGLWSEAGLALVNAIWKGLMAKKTEPRATIYPSTSAYI